MTTDDRPPGPRGARRRTMQDDLLQDLRQATPVPVAPPAGERAPEAPVARDGQPASLRLEVTVQRWSWPRLRVLPGRSGVAVGIGPVRVSCALVGR